MISDKDLDALIEGLTEYRDKGVRDPWVLSDGTIIEPLDVIKELKELRSNINDLSGLGVS